MSDIPQPGDEFDLSLAGYELEGEVVETVTLFNGERDGLPRMKLAFENGASVTLLRESFLCAEG